MSGSKLAAFLRRGTRSTTEEFRIGVFGGGKDWINRATHTTNTLSGRRVVLAAIAARDSDAVQKLAAATGAAAFDGFKPMVDKVDLDAVIVAAPPKEQEAAVLYALAHGKHVLCDEPFGCSAEEASRMIEAAHRAGRVLAGGYLNPLQAEWSHRFVGDGGIGTAQLVEALWFRPSRAFVPVLLNGRGFWDLRAAHIGESAAGRLLSVALPMLGSPAVAVSATVSRSEAPERRSTALTLVVEGANGARAQLLASEGVGLEKEDFYVLCHGSDGQLQVPLIETGSRWFSALAVHSDRRPVLGPSMKPIGRQIVRQQHNWVMTCRGEAELLSPPEDALLVHEVLDAAYRSAAIGGDRLTI